MNRTFSKASGWTLIIACALASAPARASGFDCSQARTIRQDLSSLKKTEFNSRNPVYQRALGFLTSTNERILSLQAAAEASPRKVTELETFLKEIERCQIPETRHASHAAVGQTACQAPAPTASREKSAPRRHPDEATAFGLYVSGLGLSASGPLARFILEAQAQSLMSQARTGHLANFKDAARAKELLKASASLRGAPGHVLLGVGGFLVGSAIGMKIMQNEAVYDAMTDAFIPAASLYDEKVNGIRAPAPEQRRAQEARLSGLLVLNSYRNERFGNARGAPGCNEPLAVVKTPQAKLKSLQERAEEERFHPRGPGQGRFAVQAM